MEEIVKPKWSFKKAIKNSFKWDNTDWTYIKTHITWILIILLLSYLYWTEVKVAREFINSPCVHKCQTMNYIEEFKKNNPDININCDDTGICHFSGVYDPNLRRELEDIGINVTK